MENTNIDSLSNNSLSYILNFLDNRSLFKSSLVSKKFYNAFEKDHIWQSRVLKEILFVNKNKLSSWKNYFIKEMKIKQNFQEGKSNKSFKMKPLRGHTSYITFIEFNDKNDSLYSADIHGDVLTWKINEDDDYEPIKLLNTNTRIFGMKILNEQQNSSDLLILSEKEIYLCDISSLYKMDQKWRIDFDNIEIGEYAIEKGFLFTCPNYHLKLKIKGNNFIHIINLKTGNITKKIEFNYYGFQLSNLLQNSNSIDLKQPLNPFIKKANSMIVIDSFVIILNNFDNEQFKMIHSYKNLDLHNLHFINTQNNWDKIRFLYKDVYLHYIKKMKDHLVLLGVDRDQVTNFFFLSLQDFQILGKINMNDITGFYFLDYSSLLLKNKDGIMKELRFDIKEKSSNLINFDINIDVKNLVINDIVIDNYKFVIGCADNTCKIFSLKEKKMWHNLLGGSMSVIPKSFVVNPFYQGFSKIILTNSSLICVLGNLIRIYNFGN